eukprot:TRINITY_DN4671_c1_g1_i1.p1 TRINITY_DN4671_c1_g1~~TRINITY_DN4671_c1_g1_i1.p1  ORF type:complete len:660 (+),score=92.01 TRINITY_DN4671_c1_g1_i1:22-2001(+)
MCVCVCVFFRSNFVVFLNSLRPSFCVQMRRPGRGSCGGSLVRRSLIVTLAVTNVRGGQSAGDAACKGLGAGDDCGDDSRCGPLEGHLYCKDRKGFACLPLKLGEPCHYTDALGGRIGGRCQGAPKGRECLPLSVYRKQLESACEFKEEGRQCHFRGIDGGEYMGRCTVSHEHLICERMALLDACHGRHQNNACEYQSLVHVEKTQGKCTLQGKHLVCLGRAPVNAQHPGLPHGDRAEAGVAIEVLDACMSLAVNATCSFEEFGEPVIGQCKTPYGYPSTILACHPSAVAACEDKPSGGSCQFSRREGVASGKCRSENGRTVCQHELPAEAACVSRAADAVCSFHTDSGTASGRCRQGDNGPVVCIPEKKLSCEGKLDGEACSYHQSLGVTTGECRALFGEFQCKEAVLIACEQKSIGDACGFSRAGGRTQVGFCDGIYPYLHCQADPQLQSGSLTVVVENIDYNQLSTKQTVVRKFAAAVRQAVAESTQHDRISSRSVDLRLSAGSVKVEAQIVYPTELSWTTVSSSLDSSLKSSIVQKLSAIPEVEALATGAISASVTVERPAEALPAQPTTPAAVEAAGGGGVTEVLAVMVALLSVGVISLTICNCRYRAALKEAEAPSFLENAETPGASTPSPYISDSKVAIGKTAGGFPDERNTV